MNVSQVIETKEVKVQASPVPTPGLTPLKVYDATCEVVETTFEWPVQYSNSVRYETLTQNIYMVVDDNGKTRRFGNEFFRQVT